MIEDGVKTQIDDKIDLKAVSLNLKLRSVHFESKDNRTVKKKVSKTRSRIRYRKLWVKNSKDLRLNWGDTSKILLRSSRNVIRGCRMIPLRSLSFNRKRTKVRLMNGTSIVCWDSLSIVYLEGVHYSIDCNSLETLTFVLVKPDEKSLREWWFELSVGYEDGQRSWWYSSLRCNPGPQPQSARLNFWIGYCAVTLHYLSL